MQLVAIFAFIFIIGVLGDRYTDRYDNIDLQQILGNDRLLKNYIDCLLERGKCTKDAAVLKKTIPDALETGCTKCTEKQRSAVRQVIKYISENKKSWWAELQQKYDPTGEYTRTYQELNRSEGIRL